MTSGGNPVASVVRGRRRRRRFGGGIDRGQDDLIRRTTSTRSVLSGKRIAEHDARASRTTTLRQRPKTRTLLLMHFLNGVARVQFETFLITQDNIILAFTYDVMAFIRYQGVHRCSNSALRKTPLRVRLAANANTSAAYPFKRTWKTGV